MGDIQQFDLYEESYYERVTVTVETERGVTSAFTYIDTRTPLPFPMSAWDVESFKKNYLPTFTKNLKQGWKAVERRK